MSDNRGLNSVTDEPDLMEEAIRILEACDPGECGCGQPHRIPEGHEGLINQMVRLLRERS